MGVPRVEVATAGDVEALAALRVEQGWYRSEMLVRAVEQWDRGRIFIIRAASLGADSDIDGNPELPVAATAATASGPVGVIGNVVVRADYRRRGLGRLVMEAALAWQRAAGVASVFLDATQEGRPLYARLGFQPVVMSYYAHAPIARLDRAALREHAGGLVAHPAPDESFARYNPLDVGANGGDRSGLLRYVLRQPDVWLFTLDGADGQPAGYLMARLLEVPRMGVRAGPWIARDDAAAAALLEALLGEDARWRAVLGHERAHAAHLYCSPPGTNPAALELLSTVKVETEDDDLIMRLDFPDQPPAVRREDHIYGWLAPMVF